jgi:prepilin-type N-terminal cleavage/methylation domain-containing protein
MVQNRYQRGYSLIELLTVVAIIGVMSLVSVPAFLNYQRSLEVKSSMRQFTADLRAARQRAVTNQANVTVDVPAAGATARTYTITETRNQGGIGAPPRNRTFTSDVPFFSNTATFTFLPNGSLNYPAGTASRAVTIDSQNKTGKKSYVITVFLSGRITTQ